ncbi:polysaccharide lyase family 8 super-sandwich domain-containing protein [Massilia terrae]|uniref:Polysaccharide lyase beta-sandwich domain-containing protein n=1 Tax=Massilia terrae TaxID=1811224 RepID=A0ABT2CTN4_9BURK|nr:polysaccharide lyase family 8 super-sandwich domain-containing protein [Massilia terrae]MCS0657145.1 polysaccharide lyase beta-sandwich domain-containing protein [Massilia terrae]
MQRDRTYGAAYLGAPGGVGTSGVSLYDLGLLRAIAADPATAAAPEPPGARLYPSMDRAVLRGPGFAAVLSLTSPRTSSFEFGNGENLRGWWTGMGSLAVYDADQAQFDGPYWPTIDSGRLPGTTTDHSGSGRPVEWKQYPNLHSWVGGASLDGFAALGMDFSMRGVTGSGLQGKKSWFLLGERIVALGAGIGGGEGAAETIVENRRLRDAAGARLLVDGRPLANGKREGARWAWLEDRQAGSHLGYLFPAGAELVSERAERSGSWRDLNEQGGSEVLHATYQSLAIPHGASSYAYVLLPNASEAATRAAAADPGLRIEANDTQAAAVSQSGASLYAANLWQAGSAPRAGEAYLRASGPAAVLVRGGEAGWRIAVADPTQGQDTLDITLEQPVGALQQADPGVTVLATAPRLRLRIATKGAAGATFGASFGPR